jgi:hypothetical protein
MFEKVPRGQMVSLGVHEAQSRAGQPSPTIAQWLNGGYGWLRVKCHRCETGASIPLDANRRPRDTSINLRRRRNAGRARGRYAPPGGNPADHNDGGTDHVGGALLAFRASGHA